MRKAKYYLVGLLVLVALLFVYHFYAARQAEQQISNALDEQAQQYENINLSYSDIDVSAFSGDVTFQKLNITQGDYIHRTAHLNFELTYFDFLRLYIGGTEFGLRRIDNLHATFENLSILYQPEVRELKIDTLNISYAGNLFDLLRHTITKAPTERKHTIEGTGKAFRINQPQAPWGQVRSDSIFFSTIASPQTASLWNIDRLTIKNSSIIWNPPQSFQDRYSFFLRGFGYQPNSLPIDSTKIELIRKDTLSPIAMEADLYTDLFHAHAEADLQLNKKVLRNSNFRDGTLGLAGTSEEFKNFLSSAEKLFDISLSGERKEIANFYGPLLNPRFITPPTSNQ